MRLRSILPLLSVISISLMAADPVAMIADVTGKVVRGEGGVPRITEMVAAGQELVLASGARIVLVGLAKGEEWVFQGPGKVHFNSQGRPEGLQPQGSNKAPLLKGQVKLKPGALAQASIVMRDVAPEAAPRLLPEGPVLLNRMPHLTWKSPNPGATFLLRLMDGKGKLLAELTLNEPGLDLPEHLALQPGGELVWMLETRDAGGSRSQSQGHYRLISGDESALLEQNRPTDTSSFAARLIYASLLEQIGLRDESRTWWQALSAERPEDPVLAALGRKAP